MAPGRLGERRTVLRVTIHERVGSLDAARWDALGSDPFSATPVLAALEGAHLPGIRMWLAVVEDARGRWIAAAPLARVEVDAGRLTHGLFRRGISAARRLRPDFLRTALFLCGTPLSVGNAPVRWAKHALPRERSDALIELGEAVRTLAGERSAPWCAFKEFSTAERSLAREALGASGWALAPSEPGSVLDLPWPSYEGYVASLRSPYRRRLRKAEGLLERAGVEVDVVPLGGVYDAELHALYEAVVDRAAIQLERLTPAFFMALGRALGERALLVRFQREGRAIGWVAVLADGPTAYDLFHGIDYAASASCDLYFNQLAAVIRVALERGARRLSLGQSTEIAKARFGARSAPLWIALRHRSPVLSTALRWARRPLFPPRSYPACRVFADPAGRAAATRACRPSASRGAR
jgi:predicted N-acyltransferase